MKIKTLRAMRIDGKTVGKGDTVEVDDALGRRLVGAGRARPLDAKSPKPQRETTEKAAPETAAKG